jgi:hypothetical protein
MLLHGLGTTLSVLHISRYLIDDLFMSFVQTFLQKAFWVKWINKIIMIMATGLGLLALRARVECNYESCLVIALRIGTFTYFQIWHFIFEEMPKIFKYGFSF